MVEPKEKTMEKSENIYINLVRNPAKQAGDNLPMYVAPKNDKFPDKNWTIGVNIDGAWYNQAAFQAKDPNGNLTDGLTIKLTPNKSSGGAATKNSFAKAETGGSTEYNF